jgi:capsular exopolysaccharide synthesis family protein
MIDEKVNGKPPAVAEVRRVALPLPAPVREPEITEPAVPLSQYLWILKRHRWKILGAVAMCVIGTAIVSARLTPIYEATATIDIDRRIPTGILGEEAVQSALNDADQFMATQVKLIQSDSVLRPVDHQYNLRRREAGATDSELLRTAEAEGAPVVLKKLKVTRPPNTYLLLVSYRSPDRQEAADVANATVRSYLEHTYKIRYQAAAGLSQFMERQLEELRAKMERSSAALAQFERELNVINPEERTNIVSARLLQLNTEYTSAQAERVKRETAFHSVRSGTLAAAQVSSQGGALDKLTEALNESRRRFVDAQTHYGANHPEYRKALAQVAEVERALEDTRDSIAQRVEIEYHQAVERESMLRTAVAETKAEFDRLNARSFEYQTLKQEADTDKKLYEELVRKIKEAGINASFQNSSIRIADLARSPLKPVFPDMPLNLTLAFLFSTLFAVGAAVVSDILDNTIRDPEQVRRTLKIAVVGSLPVIKNWRGQLRPVSIQGNGTGLLRVNGSAERDLTPFDEAIRTLRNSILLTDFERRLRSLLLTSASPSEGKSTVAVHLAMAHAGQRKRTLLIDGDLRRPSIHKFFEIPNNLGLSKVLVYDLAWREALVQPKPGLELYVLPAGPSAPRAANQIGTVLPQLLEEASLEFDLVILDAPPLLGFPEPLEMAAAVDGVIVVTRAGQTNRAAVASVLATLADLRASAVGLVLNEVRKELSHSYYYYGHYEKYYKQPQGER